MHLQEVALVVMVLVLNAAGRDPLIHFFLTD